MIHRIRQYMTRLRGVPSNVVHIDEKLTRIERRLDELGLRTSDATATAPPTNEPPIRSYASATPPLRSEHVSGAVLYADRNDALAEVRGHGRVAEIGVAVGGFSAVILARLAPVQFDAIDYFRLHELPGFWGRTSDDWFGDQTHRQSYESRFADAIASGVMIVHEGDSSTIISQQPDGFYDMIYIDGDHSSDGVLRDAEASAPKLNAGGLLVFNDYIMMDHLSGDPYGVVPVVNDFCVNRGWTVAYFAFQPDLFCDIGLRRRT